jgi:hypothetical protein
MNLNKLLDHDLAAELRKQVKNDGLLWDSLPTKLKVRYLNPFIARQVERESNSLVGVIRENAA